MDKKDKYIIDAKIEEIQSILEFLEKEYGVEYLFSFLKLANVKDQYGKFIRSLKFSETFFKQLSGEFQRVKQKMEFVPSLIRQGFDVVECINNDNKPVDYPLQDWLIVGEIYIVGQIIVKDKKVFYKLKAQNRTGNVEYLFSVTRFTKYTLNETQN